MKSIDEVHKKIESFVRKYYVNSIIRGVLLFVLLFIVAFLSLVSSEYLGHFSILVRTILYFSAITILVLVALIWIVRPFLALNKIIKTIGHQEINAILRVHFPDLKDHLQNVLELEANKDTLYSSALLEAAIEQKSKEIRVIPFSNAIQFKSNLKYLKLIAVPVLILLILYAFSPKVIQEGTERMVNYDTYYEKPSDFWFVVENESLSVRNGNNLTIKVHTEGKYIPNPIYIKYGGLDYLLQQKGENTFLYEFNQVHQNFEFTLKAEDYQSKKYSVEVLPNPQILSFEIDITPPAYTHLDAEKIRNNGDLLVPVGSKVTWQFKTVDVDKLWFSLTDSSLFAKQEDAGRYNLSVRLLEDINYTVNSSNRLFSEQDVLKYKAQVIPDEFPNIQIQTALDSARLTAYYFRGQVSDDYGISKVNFCYRIEDEEKIHQIQVPEIGAETLQEFFYAFDFKDFIKNGQRLSYFFEVWDNDAVNGSKRSQSKVFQYYLPSQEELNQLEEESATDMQEKLSETQKLAKELRSDIKNLKKEMVEKDLNSWEMNQKLESLNEKQSNLQKLMKEVAQENEKTNELLKQLSDQDQQLLEKQQQIEEMLNQLMDEEMKKMMEEINKLMDEFNKDKFNELSEEMEMSMEDLSEQLDRNLEQLKRFEVEKKMYKTIDELKELAKEHQKLSEETREGEKDSEALKEKQEEHQKTLEEIQKELEETRKKNEALEEPMKIDDFSKQMNELQEQMQKSQQNLEKGKKKKASKGQKSSADKMKAMAAQMEQMMSNMMMQQQAQDMEGLKQIIENVNSFSFEQEDVMINYRGISNKSPKYIELFNRQNKTQENFELIKDSLYALAKTQPMLAAPINKEILNIERELIKTEKSLEDRRTGTAQQSQQTTMMSANNLTLLLSEVLEQMKMQQQQQSSCQKGGSCPNPGKNSKPGFGQAKKQAQSLKSQMQNMLQQLKEGNKDGQKGSKGQKGMNGKLGKMIAEHEKMQKMLSDLANSQGVSPESAKKLKEIKRQSEFIEDELIRQNVTPSLLKRQELILTRLLEAENSEFKRELDKKRESKTSYNEQKSNPKEFFKDKDKENMNSNILIKQKLKLNSFYKKEYQNYMIKLND